MSFRTCIDRPELVSHLAKESFIALAQCPRREWIVDHSMHRRCMKGGFLLALAFMLSKRVGEWTSKPRVGIVFPPGLAGYIANLTVSLAGKVPVNLNYTLGSASIEACLREADIDCLLTTEGVEQKMPLFPWPDSGLVDLVDAIKSLPKAKTLLLLAGMHLFPARLLAKLLKIPSKGGDLEAGLLFTMGRSGEPKGVSLSHRSILSDCRHIDAAGLLSRSEKLIVNLPFFHSFGFTVTLWYPLLRSCSVVTLPSPLDVEKTADVIAAEKATVLIGTPTFFKSYIQRVAPEKLASLKYVVAGFERTPAGFADAWEAHFGSEYIEGDKLIEASLAEA